MAVKFRCRKCSTVMRARDELIGKKVRCKKCGTPVTVRPRRAAAANDEASPFAALSELENEGQAIGRGKHMVCRSCGEIVGGDSLECTSCGTAVKPKKVRKSRSKGESDGDDSQKTSSAIGKWIISGLTVCVAVGLVVVIGYQIKKTAGGGDGTTRVQKEYLGKTTELWFYHRRRDERPEKLWRDQRWMTMGQVVGLDWAAVPLLLDAVTDERTSGLAEKVLDKYQSTTGSPYVEDLQAGLKHQDPRVRLWAARLVTKLDRPAPEIIPVLEEAAKQEDSENGVATVAVKHLRSLETDETKK